MDNIATENKIDMMSNIIKNASIYLIVLFISVDVISSCFSFPSNFLKIQNISNGGIIFLFTLIKKMFFIK